MSKIRKRERKNWFYSYNMIFDMDISTNEKIVYLYLCRCADEESQAFPSYSTIAKKCSISRTTAIRAVSALVEIGLLEKVVRIIEKDGKTSRTSNLYYIYDAPPQEPQKSEVVSQIHQGWYHTDTRVVSQVHQGGITDTPKGLPNEGLPNEGLLPPLDTTTEAPEPENVVVVDKHSDQASKKTEPATKEEIKKIQELARTEGIKLTQKNIKELLAVADGDTEQVENGILAAAEYARTTKVRNMWGLIQQAVATGKVPALSPSAQKLEEIRLKEEKYRDVYVR